MDTLFSNEKFNEDLWLKEEIKKREKKYLGKKVRTTIGIGIIKEVDEDLHLHFIKPNEKYGTIISVRHVKYVYKKL